MYNVQFQNFSERNTTLKMVGFELNILEHQLKFRTTEPRVLLLYKNINYV